MRSQSVLVGMVLWEEVRRKRSQALIPSNFANVSLIP